MKFKKKLGIDIGASGIKGAPVNTKKGKLIKSRKRIITPEPSSPEAVSDAIEKIIIHFKWKGPAGGNINTILFYIITFPDHPGYFPEKVPSKGVRLMIERPRVISSAYSSSSPKETPLARVVILISRSLNFRNR